MDELRRKVIHDLREYRNNSVCINLIRMDLQSLMDQPRGIDNLGISYDQPSTGKTYKITSVVENEVERIDEKIRKHEQALSWREHKKARIDAALRSMTHDKRRLLQMRYIEDYQWWQVADALGYSYEYTRKELNAQAVQTMVYYLYPTMQFQEDEDSLFYENPQ